MTTLRASTAILFVTGTLALLSCTALAGDLVVNEQAIGEFLRLRQEPKFVDQYGIITPQERAMLEPVINDLLDRLLAGLKTHPEKFWVIEQMKPTVEEFYLEDTELRDRCVEYILRIFSILRIDGADGAFEQYYLDL